MHYLAEESSAVKTLIRLANKHRHLCGWLLRTGAEADMKEQRWLRIIPVALIMYTISYIDRTNISLALDKSISSMMKDLLMDDKMKGFAGGIFLARLISAPPRSSRSSTARRS